MRGEQGRAAEGWFLWRLRYFIFPSPGDNAPTLLARPSRLRLGDSMFLVTMTRIYVRRQKKLAPPVFFPLHAPAEERLFLAAWFTISGGILTWFVL